MSSHPTSTKSPSGPENRLARETSPYLLQHRDNPVDWYPWGEEALARARELDRPILLSVGYSACHWCHVMERESFEDAETAAYMNAHFVSVKVDREERPDVDALYMEAVQAISGHGGWPMTVFCDPDGVPFYGGTYFPPDDRYGRAGFGRILERVADAWRTDRQKILESSIEVIQQLQKQAETAPATGSPVTESVTVPVIVARGVCGTGREWKSSPGVGSLPALALPAYQPMPRAAKMLHSFDWCEAP